MTELKDFWKTQEETSFDKKIDKEYVKGWQSAITITKDELGMFFWERRKGYERLINLHKQRNSPDQYNNHYLEVIQELLAESHNDALACLGEEKIRKLISELVGGKTQ